MNKKYILCIFAVLITITNSSYAFPAYSKPTTVPTNKRPLVPTRWTFNTPSKVGTSNTTEISVDDVNNLSAVGKLDIVKSDGSPDCCTASVIRTDNGNLAITAASCLFDLDTKTLNTEVYFSPGYNNGQQGKVGKVPVTNGYSFQDFVENPMLYDYALIKIDYPDGKKLQDDTGAFDYDLDIPHNDYPVSVFGYPIDGDMNCSTDGQHLCEYDGPSTDIPPGAPIPSSYRVISIDAGQCSSGGPWVRNYDPNANTGNVMGVSLPVDILPIPDPELTAAWSWGSDEFTALLNFAQS